MDKLLLTMLATLSAATAFGQNSVTIVQSGGAGNTASVSQSGEGNSVSINQQGSAGANGRKVGNRVSLHVPRGTETTVNQTNPGPNVVEISQEGQATATINQSSATNDNTINVLPGATPDGDKTRSPNRRRRRQ
ncbi:curlin repeat-containing protein [Fibrella sp. WM1]|uniref:curlin repeat-containing protein n=1 Tax=Fibrella musci TaxID=3242485 RepID=UPI0035216495